jgi:GrpB protein
MSKVHQWNHWVMIAHPEDAQSYSDLKQKLAREYPTNIDGYIDGKDYRHQQPEWWARKDPLAHSNLNRSA